MNGAIAAYDNRSSDPKVPPIDEPIETDTMKRMIQLDDGQSIGLIEQGSGSAIVFVHGLPGQASDFAPIFDHLAPHRRTVVYDRVGYGSSPSISTNRKGTISDNVEALIDILDRLEIKSATLVGWSYGGDIAITTAVHFPQRVSSLVLVGSVGPSFVWPPAFIERVMFKSPFASALVKCARALGPRAIAPMLSDAYGEPVPRRLLAEFVDLLATPGTIARWIEEGRCWDPKNCPAQQVTQPTLIIHGTNDTRVPLAVAKANAQLIPKATAHWLPDAGHWPCHSHPETVAKWIEEFLTR